MKKTMFMAVLMMASLTMPMVSCSSESSDADEVVNGKGKPLVQTRGFWDGEKFVELKTADKTNIFVMARNTENAINNEAVLSTLSTLDEVQGVEALSAPYENVFQVTASKIPQHSALFASYKYRCSEGVSDDEFYVILPKIYVSLASGITVEEFLGRYGEHLRLNDTVMGIDEVSHYCFDCDLSSSDELLDLNIKIFNDDAVQWSDPARLVFSAPLYS